MPVASLPPAMTTKNVSRHCQVSSGGKKSPWVENPWCGGCSGSAESPLARWVTLGNVLCTLRASGPHPSWDQAEAARRGLQSGLTRILGSCVPLSLCASWLQVLGGRVRVRAQETGLGGDSRVFVLRPHAWPSLRMQER